MLGIIGCQVLEDEIAYVICQDEALRSVLVVESPEAKGIADKIRRGSSKQVIELNQSQLNAFGDMGDNSVIVWIKPIGLHQSPHTLREEVVANALRIQPLCNSLLIFYGLCGSAFKAIDNISAQFSIPVFILRDAQNMIVDDCIGTVLGGTEEYRQFLVEDCGGYTLNTMWAMNWPFFMHEVQLLRDPNDLEEAVFVFKCMEYKNVVMLNTGLGDQQEFQSRAEDFAQKFQLGLVEKHCTLKVVETSYKLARAAGH